MCNPAPSLLNSSLIVASGFSKIFYFFIFFFKLGYTSYFSIVDLLPAVDGIGTTWFGEAAWGNAWKLSSAYIRTGTALKATLI